MKSTSGGRANENKTLANVENLPANAGAFSWMGQPDEAIAEGKRAVELDPLNLKYNSNLAQMYRNARRL